MVQLDKVQGQKGHMIIHEDGTIIASSGELASSESTSQQVTSLMAHSLPVIFTKDKSTVALNGSGSFPTPDSNVVNGASARGHNNHTTTVKPVKWNRITVNFGDKSYMACLSNRRLHVIKRGHDE